MLGRERNTDDQTEARAVDAQPREHQTDGDGDPGHALQDEVAGQVLIGAAGLQQAALDRQRHPHPRGHDRLRDRQRVRVGQHRRRGPGGQQAEDAGDGHSDRADTAQPADPEPPLMPGVAGCGGVPLHHGDLQSGTAHRQDQEDSGLDDQRAVVDGVERPCEHQVGQQVAAIDGDPGDRERPRPLESSRERRASDVRHPSPPARPRLR
ncbi:hypothetical protein [Candidatus Protofrankia datiscae]|uniref:hypothetical protein n=1 Tax=Candidatus Protofrankia datiscae TaxID=2716812 RepID=UPI00104108A8|nr:hypothetical protein [Candidatus Protofrankia datiscae]